MDSPHEPFELTGGLYRGSPGELVHAVCLERGLRGGWGCGLALLRQDLQLPPHSSPVVWPAAGSGV